MSWIVSTSRRKRKDRSFIWRASLRRVNEDGTKTTYYCEHDHRTREDARECARVTLEHYERRYPDVPEDRDALQA